jgi:hypothetical protein
VVDEIIKCLEKEGRGHGGVFGVLVSILITLMGPHSINHVYFLSDIGIINCTIIIIGNLPFAYTISLIIIYISSALISKLFQLLYQNLQRAYSSYMIPGI